jgi:hypothetical protein
MHTHEMGQCRRSSRKVEDHVTASTRIELIPNDLRLTAAFVRGALEPYADRDWSINARDLEWSCTTTARHMVEAMLIYSGRLATRSPERRQSPIERMENPEYTPTERLDMLEVTASMLAAVADGSPPEAIGYHPSGMPDREGYLAMGCSEMLTHGFDIASALGAPYDPPRDLAARITARLYPWTALDGDPWEALLWSAGRIALPNRSRQDDTWEWHPMPLTEL